MPSARPLLDIRDVNICSVTATAGFSKFVCGISEIDEWSRTKAADRDRRNRSRVFCAVIDGDPSVLGFYSLSLRASDPKHVAAEIVRDYNEAGFVPLVYIDYLAVQRELQGQKLGTLLLMDALRRCREILRNTGCAGVALNALTPQATTWYERFGFRQRQKGVTQFPLMVLPAQSLLDLPDGR